MKQEYCSAAHHASSGPNHDLAVLSLSYNIAKTCCILYNYVLQRNAYKFKDTSSISIEDTISNEITKSNYCRLSYE